jgi:acetyl-CoA synthetase
MSLTPAWIPTKEGIAASNPGRLMAQRGFPDFASLHAWSVADRAGFWGEMAGRLGLRFRTPPETVLDPAGGIEEPRWFPGAKLNIAESCFAGDPERPAIVSGGEGRPVATMTLGDLDALSARVARGLLGLGLDPGAPVAIAMPMTAEAVAVWLGIVKAGFASVGIAESFTAAEIGARLRISRAEAVITADVVLRGGKVLPLYEKVAEAGAPRTVVLPAGERLAVALRASDVSFEQFLPESGVEAAAVRDPDDLLTILFSSGTTGDPKAIPWTHLTPLKCASDACLHHDIRPGDVVAWPTGFGWMMGPWLVFASLVNRAAMALFDGAPTGRDFCEFVRDARVTHLGLVPSLVSSWRASGAAEGVDWSGIRLFSSTGECSNPDDMRWLMARAGGKPVIEYCGGTEIGGGYVTGTVTEPCVPGTFNTKAAGLDFVLLDDDGREAQTGEAFLVPPAVGLSTRLLNREHHEVYFDGAPAGPHGEVLRRHGDRIERLPGGLFRAHGRVDDTMKLGGIKVSAAEIEGALAGIAGLAELAAVAIPPAGGGPDRLVVFAVPAPGATPDPEELRARMNAALREALNPLFKVEEVRLLESLPRTASNKLLRRLLR